MFALGVHRVYSFCKLETMDWIRRNFPDLLIGLALVVVIGAIIATLLSGGSFLPFGGSQTSTASISSSGVTAPITTNTTSNNQAVNTTASTETSTALSANTSSPIIPVGPDSTDSDTGSSVTVEVPPVIPIAADAVGNAANAVGNAAGNAAASVSAAAAETVANVTNTVTHTADSLTTTTTAATASANMAAPYRVSVGAFSNPANAKKRVEVFKAKGFPAFSAKQGTLSLVLVGPYETKAEAVKVASEIKSSGLEPGATVIKYNPNATISQPSASNSGSGATTAVSAVATSPAATTTASSVMSSGASVTTPTTSAAGSYLQVGAYNNSETAQPLRRQLSKLGFETYELQDGNLIKVLVGPYDAKNLAIAQSVLKTNGFDSFVR